MADLLTWPTRATQYIARGKPPPPTLNRGEAMTNEERRAVNKMLEINGDLNEQLAERDRIIVEQADRLASIAKDLSRSLKRLASLREEAT